jgi:undecaprenyl-diphosphatase
MISGGFIFLFIDSIFKNPEVHNEEEIKPLTAFKIGMYQCLAILFPGLSRSAATIIGGMSLKLTRATAAEFSFFLAVPTMLAATGYKLLSFAGENGGFEDSQIKLLLIGNVVAFFVALLAIRFFIQFLQKHGFKVWGYYRIAVGILILILTYAGIIQS